MHSPLPDSSALEAGILEDERPSRLSHVQDNVRNLLRTSVFGSVASSPKTPTRPMPQSPHVLPHSIPVHFSAGPEVLPSPASTSSTGTATTSTTSSTTSTIPARPANLAVPATASTSYHQMVQHMAHQSALFNTRAVEALNHPDLSDPSLEDFDQQKLQRRERRALRGLHKKEKIPSPRAIKSRVLLSVLSAVLLAALVATYLALITTSSVAISTAFHVMFILGILLATILFAYSIARLCVLDPSRSRSRRRHRNRARGWISSSRTARSHHAHHRPPRHPRRHREREREAPSLSTTDAYVPPTPIQVHFDTDHTPPSIPLPAATPSPTLTTTTATAPRETPEVPLTAAAAAGTHDWNKDTPIIANPPPAYGRWRGSVRADPDLLHWQAVPSPATPNLPSPTYDEAVAAGSAAAAAAAAATTRAADQRASVREEEEEEEDGSRSVVSESSPPSYVTRESPRRGREVREATMVRSQVVVPEMVEVRAERREGEKVPWDDGVAMV